MLLQKRFPRVTARLLAELDYHAEVAARIETDVITLHSATPRPHHDFIDINDLLQCRRHRRITVDVEKPRPRRAP